MNTTTKFFSPPTLDDAIALAKKAHDGQTDKADAPWRDEIFKESQGRTKRMST